MQKLHLFAWIDITKLIMSFGVVAIHVSTIFPSYSQCTDDIVQVVVPMFFVIAGFFYGNKYFATPNTNRNNVFTKTLKRLLLLYGVWTLIYAPVAFIYLLNHWSVFDSIKLYLWNVIMLGQNMMSWHLWYLLATIVSVVLIHLLMKIGVKLGYVVVLGLCLYALGVWLVNNPENTFLESYPMLFPDTQNGVFRGLCYVSLGMLLSKMFDVLPIWVYGLSALIGVGVFFINVPLCYPFVAFGSVGLILSLPKQDIVPSFSVWARNISTVIYLSHMYLIAIMQQILHLHFGFTTSYIIVLPSAMLVAIFWMWISKYRAFSFLRKII